MQGGGCVSKEICGFEASHMGDLKIQCKSLPKCDLHASAERHWDERSTSKPWPFILRGGLSDDAASAMSAGRRAHGSAGVGAVEVHRQPPCCRWEIREMGAGDVVRVLKETPPAGIRVYLGLAAKDTTLSGTHL